MRITAAVIALACAAATTASAGPGRLSDMDYLRAARCGGLAASGVLGEIDVADIDAKLRAHGAGRQGFIQDKADAARSDAKRAAKRAGAEHKAVLQSEWTACQQYFG
jgi:hypothetical protein